MANFKAAINTLTNDLDSLSINPINLTKVEINQLDLISDIVNTLSSLNPTSTGKHLQLLKEKANRLVIKGKA